VRDNPEFEAFVRARSGSLLRTAVLLAGDYGHAEDLLQVALLRTARHWRTARAAPQAYVRQALVNLCRDRWRRLKARPRESPMLPGSSDVPMVAGPAELGGAEQVLQRRFLVQALSRLPAGQRQVIVLRYFEDLPVAETAELLGISPGTVKSQTARAMAALREVLGDADGINEHTQEASNAH
jgi:RNA polymerase sigma-70 factor (sigma-E family)